MHTYKTNIENKVYNYYFDNLTEARKISEIKNILINGENCKDLKAYFTRYVHKKLIKILGLHYHELMGTSEEQEAKKLFDG